MWELKAVKGKRWVWAVNVTVLRDSPGKTFEI